MAIEKIKPQDQSVLTEEDEIRFFYKILCLWESKKQNLQCIKFDDSALKKFQQSKGLELPHDKKNKPIEIVESHCNQIQFKGSGSKSRLLILRIRNAFAHNHIEKRTILSNSDNSENQISIEYLHLQDWKGKNCKMDAMIRYNDLKELIRIILKWK